MNQKCDNHKDIRYQIGKLGIFILVPVVAVLSNDPLNGTCFCWLAYIGCCQSPLWPPVQPPCHPDVSA